MLALSYIMKLSLHQESYKRTCFNSAIQSEKGPEFLDRFPWKSTELCSFKFKLEQTGILSARLWGINTALCSAFCECLFNNSSFSFLILGYNKYEIVMITTSRTERRKHRMLLYAMIPELGSDWYNI